MNDEINGLVHHIHCSDTLEYMMMDPVNFFKVSTELNKEVLLVENSFGICEKLLQFKLLMENGIVVII